MHINKDHPQCNVPRKALKACQGKGQGTLPLREWPCCPFSSTGLGSLVVSVNLSHLSHSVADTQALSAAGRHWSGMWPAQVLSTFLLLQFWASQHGFLALPHIQKTFMFPSRGAMDLHLCPKGNPLLLYYSLIHRLGLLFHKRIRKRSPGGVLCPSSGNCYSLSLLSSWGVSVKTLIFSGRNYIFLLQQRNYILGPGEVTPAYVSLVG